MISFEDVAATLVQLIGSTITFAVPFSVGASENQIAASLQDITERFFHPPELGQDEALEQESTPIGALPAMARRATCEVVNGVSNAAAAAAAFLPAASALSAGSWSMAKRAMGPLALGGMGAGLSFKPAEIVHEDPREALETPNGRESESRDPRLSPDLASQLPAPAWRPSAAEDAAATVISKAWTRHRLGVLEAKLDTSGD